MSGLDLRQASRDTIVAVSTPPGPSTLAVLRLSGAGVRNALAARALAGVAGRAPSLEPFHHEPIRLRVAGRELVAGLSFFAAPRSYTGEDLAEITVPGSAAVVSAVLGEFLDEPQAARLAQPGEFTLRAFLHGKLDLTQAEAVGRLIHAAGKSEARAAYRQLGGRFGESLRAVESDLVELLALVEAGIDFPDEEIPSIEPGRLRKRCDAARRKCEELLGHAVLRLPERGSLRVVLLGEPNAGKSSLVNALVGRDVALVSPMRGTTRDPLRAIDVEGDVRIEWVDLAGVEEAAWQLGSTEAAAPAEDEVERAAREALTRIGEREVDMADLILRVVDGSLSRTEEALQQGATGELAPAPPGRSSLLVVTKADRVGRDSAARGLAWRDTLLVSAQTGEGLAELRQRVAGFATRPVEAADEAAWLLSPRQEWELRACVELLGRATRALEDAAGLELVAVDLREALAALAPLTGREVSERVLGAVFGRFCIGK